MGFRKKRFDDEARGPAELDQQRHPYSSGPVINQPNGTSVYPIWSGDWSGDTSKQILTDFIQYLGDSPAYNINTTYYNSTVGRPSRSKWPA